MIRAAHLVACVSRNAGGLFHSVRRLVQSLNERQTQVRVFGIRDRFTDGDIGSWRPVPVSVFDATWPGNFGYSPGLFDALLEFSPDITHSHGLWLYPSIVSSSYGRKAGRPYLISPHGMLDPWAIRNSHLLKVIALLLYESRHLGRARCLRALCESEARSIRQLRLKNEIAVIPNGVDLPQGVPRSSPPWNGMIEYGKKVLLYLGRIHPKKGLLSLIGAWATLQRAGGRHTERANGWVLVLAGWDQGGHEQELKRAATEFGVEWADLTQTEPRPQGSERPVSGRCSLLFSGAQFDESKAACFYFCDAFVLPSLSEGVPMAVLEAWVHSKPVVITPHCNVPEGFNTGSAVRVEPTVDGVTDGLNQLFRMTDSELSYMGQAGYKLAAARFAWPRLADEMKAVYEWILGGGPKPPCMADF